MVPDDINTNTDPGLPSAVVTWEPPIVEDNVEVKAIAATFASGSSFSIGSTMVSIAAIDIYDNVNIYSFTVTVQGK